MMKLKQEKEWKKDIEIYYIKLIKMIIAFFPKKIFNDFNYIK